MPDSRAKGARGELELCRWLESLGFGPCLRSAQVAGYLSSDIICEALPAIHIECKRCQGMRPGSKLWTAAVKQAERDSAERGLPWLLFYRENKMPWCLTLRAGGQLVTVAGQESIRCLLQRLATRPEGSWPVFAMLAA